MSAIEQTYNQIIAYLKGLLSNRQRHDLEKKMMQDAFDEEAFEGLEQLSASELESDMDVLMNRLDDRIKPVRLGKPIVIYRIAAAVVLLIGIGVVIWFVSKTPASDQLTVAPVLVNKPVTAENAIPDRKDTLLIAESKPRAVVANKNEITKQADDIPETIKTTPGIIVMKEDQAFVEPQTSVTFQQRGNETASPVAISDKEDRQTITAIVVDTDGQPLPGVTVQEKGTMNGAITGFDGRFSLKVTNTNPMLILSYVGYLSLELAANDVPDRQIMMQEDLVALQEVVVTGYSTEKKKDVTGAVSTIEPNEIPGPAASEIINPVPPGGSLKAFKSWVDERLDYSKFSGSPGKHRITVTLTIHSNGSVSNIQIKESTPDSIAGEYKRVISQSPDWQPGLEDGAAIETQVVIRFAITVE